VLLYLFLRNNILSYLFIVQNNITAANCMVVQFQILFHSTCYHAAQVLSFGGPI